MRKRVLAIGIVCLLLCTACNGIAGIDGEKDSESSNSIDLILENETNTGSQENTVLEMDTEQYVIEYKEVVFRNLYEPYEHEDVFPVTNEVHHSYEKSGDDVLFAFVVYLNGSADVEVQREDESDFEYSVRYLKTEIEYIANQALEMGLMVVPLDYYCSFQKTEFEVNPLVGKCIVVGTIDQIEKLFQGTEAIDGLFWCIDSAVRPDWVDVVKEAGLSEKELDLVYVGSDTYDEKIQKVTGVDTEIVLTVPVIVSEK